MIELFLFIVVLIGGLVMLFYGTFARNRWGINLDTLSCPSCGTPRPAFRKPLSLKQAMWGGGTCHVCGTEFDKWGRSGRRQSR